MHIERIGIAGVGLVGPPLAMTFFKRLCVLGYDSDLHGTNLSRRGKSYINDV
jgi:UDP-N-acetyl-D-mannosaminuronate dehydrogenase